MKENYFQHYFIEQIEGYKVQFFADIISNNSKLLKCSITVFCDMFIAQKCTCTRTVYSMTYSKSLSKRRTSQSDRDLL